MGIDLEHSSGDHHKDDIRLNAKVNMVGCGDVGCDGNGALMNSPNIGGANKEDIRSNINGKVLDGRTKAFAEDRVDMNSLKNIDPHDGMEFESKEEAFSFYKEYAKTVGFATIIKASRRSRISGHFIDAKFVCTRYGNKRESAATESVSITESATSIPVKKKRGRVNQSWSKTDCKACMHVKRRQDGRWVIRCFIKEHNHEIFPDQAYYFRGHRNLDLGTSNVDGLHAIRARTKKLYVTMSRQSRGCKKVEKHKGGTINQLSGARHLVLDEGDAQVMLNQFMSMQDENPNFFYALDLSEEQRLRNVFWVDGKGRLDYGNFDDAVFFDTTCIKNGYKLPFAAFMGVNHHFQYQLLGCAVVADETKSTYVWLMRAWLRAVGGNAPSVIFTDQDTALKEAIAEVFPDSRHCFCLWHVLKKIPEKLSYVIRRHENFMSKFEKCIYRSWTNEQFEKRWWKMVDNFNLRNDIWVQSLYDDRELWIPTFIRNTFLAGMSTPQRPESISYFFDKYMHRKTTLKEFLEQYKAILRDKYEEEEAKADFETWHKQPALKSPSPFGKQMALLYTHAIFKKFQVEVLGVVACHPRKESEDGETKKFRVQDFEENLDFVVTWNETTLEVSCLCHVFESNGFLCRHVLIVLQMSGVHNIPSQYVLKRWTKDAKSRQTMRQGANLIESRVQRYNDLCRRAFKLGDEGSLSQESYDIAFNALEEALRKCESMNSTVQNVVEITEPSSPSVYGLNEIEEVNHGNNTYKANKKDSVSKKRREHSEPDGISIGMHDSWQRMGHSNLRAPSLDCFYESQDSMQGMEQQLNARAPTLDSYFGTQQIVHGMGQLNSIAPTRDEYYNNQHSIQGLGQLNSIAPIHDSHYMTHQRMHGMGQLHFRSSSAIPSCFDIQDGLQEMDQSNAGPSQLHGMASKHMNSKHLSS